MSYSLGFYAINLDKLRSTIEERNLSSTDCTQPLIDTVDSMRPFINGIEHRTGKGRLSEKYIIEIAGDYFGGPNIFQLMMARNDIFPIHKKYRMGLLKVR